MIDCLVILRLKLYLYCLGVSIRYFILGLNLAFEVDLIILACREN